MQSGLQPGKSSGECQASDGVCRQCPSVAGVQPLLLDTCSSSLCSAATNHSSLSCWVKGALARELQILPPWQGAITMPSKACLVSRRCLCVHAQDLLADKTQMPVTCCRGSTDNPEGCSSLMLQALEASKTNISRVWVEKFLYQKFHLVPLKRRECHICPYCQPSWHQSVIAPSGLGGFVSPLP